MNKFGKYSMFKPLALLMAALLTVLVSGCGGSGTTSTQGGAVGIYLTDAPACGYDKVYVTVSKVRVHQRYSAAENDSGWTDITLNPARKIDLLNLNNGALDNLGEAPLEAGHYTQLRLVLDRNTPGSGALANSVVLSGFNNEIPLFTPSAAQSGIKLINQFDVTSGQRVDLVLDFNACKSIVKRGNGDYALKPVIRVIPFALNGIDGFVDPALLTNNNVSKVMVTAQKDGIVFQSTAPKASGEFFLTRLAPGNYDVVITADGYATAVITQVPIETATSVVHLNYDGTTFTPVTLHASATNNIVSGMATLNPVSTNEVAYVTAKQAIGTVPAVTVKSVAANDTTGAYTMTLPVDAPWLGQYTTTPPPIVFTAQSGVAGQYTMDASATGYKTSLPHSVNLLTGNAEWDFVLAP